MTAHARCVGPENTLVEAAGLMREMDVGALPVCEENRLAGMVTDRDIVLRGTADGRDPNVTLVRDVMSSSVVSIRAEQEVEEAVRVMEDRQIRRLPVMGRAGQLVGIVSLGDIAISSNPAFSGMALRDVSEQRNPSSRQRRLAQASAPARAPVVPDVSQPRPAASRGKSASGATRTRGATRKRATKSKSSARGSTTRRSAKAKTKSKAKASR